MIKRTIAALALTLTAVFLTGCTDSVETPRVSDTLVSSQSEEEIREEAFVSVVQEHAPSMAEIPEELLIQEGKNLCETFESVELTEGAVMAWATGFVDGGNGKFSYEDAGIFMGSATAAFCPDISDEMNYLF